MVEVSNLDEGCIEPCSTCSARGISVCKVLPHRELRRMADFLSVKHYQPGEALVFDGDPADGFFNITEGVVKLFKLLPDGRRQIVGFLFRGDFLGLSVRGAYGFGAEAITRVDACRFPKRAFRNLLQDSPSLEDEMLTRACDELQAAQSQMLLLGRKTARERVASFLLDLMTREQSRGGPPNLIFLSMTRNDIGDYLGLTTETVSRVMTELKRSGVIQLLDHGGVRLMQGQHLRNMAEGLAA